MNSLGTGLRLGLVGDLSVAWQVACLLPIYKYSTSKRQLFSMYVHQKFVNTTFVQKVLVYWMFIKTFTAALLEILFFEKCYHAVLICLFTTFWCRNRSEINHWRCTCRIDINQTTPTVRQWHPNCCWHLLCKGQISPKQEVQRLLDPIQERTLKASIIYIQ